MAIDKPEVLMGFTGIDCYSTMFLINEIGPITSTRLDTTQDSTNSRCES